VFGVVVTDEMQPVDAAVDDLTALDAAGLDGRHAAEMLVELRRVTARLAAVEARLVDRVNCTRPWSEDGYRSTANWLAASDHTSLDDTRGGARLARRLRSMPATAAAFAAGDITVAHAHRLAALNGPLTAAAFADAEEFLVGQARTMRWADFTTACAYWARHARDEDPDPDRSDREHRHASLHDGLRGTGPHRGADPRPPRPPCATRWSGSNGTVRGRLGLCPGRPWRRDHDRRPGPYSPPTPPRCPRRDGHAVRHPPADGKRPRPVISVLAGYDAFAKICELADGTLLGHATVAGLLNEAAIERIVFDGPSRILDLDRARSFVGAARRAVEVADRHCQGPGCHIPAQRCDIDHTWRWADGGPTRPDSGQARCGPHNRQREHPPPRTRPAPPQRTP
jgi:hypothetical protein